MSTAVAASKLTRVIVLGCLGLAACGDHDGAPTATNEPAHPEPVGCTCPEPVPNEATPPDETGGQAGTSIGGQQSEASAGEKTENPPANSAGSPATEEAPFTPPPTATPVADYAVDHGLTSYQSVELEHGKVVTIERYNWQSKYLNFETWDLDNSPNIVQSERCVVEYNFSFGTHCLPITLGNYALEKYSKYVAGTSDAIAARNRFLEAADWFVDNQDERGGWGTEYAHEFWPARTAKLPEGWYSGMSQGLAISVLVRAFFLQHDDRYLDAARRAVGVLRTPVEQGGVKRCVDGHAFYEEYPTTPMSNVLNGYLFALIGLYDLAQVTTEPLYDAYFDEGVATVKAIISHYDLGFSTAYDLSHLQNPGAYPNRARWGYHTLHVMQLSLLRTLTKDDFFTPVIERWTGYVDGITVGEN